MKTKLGHIRVINIKTIIILCVFILMSCIHTKENSEKNIIEGLVINPNASSVVLLKKRLLPNNAYKIIDSVQVDQDGNFSFDSSLLEPNYYQIMYKDKHTKTSSLLLWSSSAKSVKIKVDTSSFTNGEYVHKIRKVKIHGSHDNTIMDSYFEISKSYYVDSIYPTKSALNKAFESSNFENSGKIDSLNEKLKHYKEESFKKLNKFLLDSMGTSMAIFQTTGAWEDTNIDFMNTVISKFETENPHSLIFPYLKTKVKKLKEKSIVGKNARAFSLLNVNGNEVLLKNYIGQKTILLDFWASWCKPCIEEIPSYRKLLEEYKKDDFVIISISTDKNMNRWKATSKKNNINWVSLIDNKKKDVSKWYKISELPTNYLIDENGQIIKKNINLVELRAYLEDLL